MEKNYLQKITAHIVDRIYGIIVRSDVYFEKIKMWISSIKKETNKNKRVHREKPVGKRRKVNAGINKKVEVDKSQYFANFHFDKSTEIIKYKDDIVPFDDYNVVYRGRAAMRNVEENGINIPREGYWQVKGTLIFAGKQVRKLELYIMEDDAIKCVMPFYGHNVITTSFCFDTWFDEGSVIRFKISGEGASGCKILGIDEKFNSFIGLQLT